MESLRKDAMIKEIQATLDSDTDIHGMNTIVKKAEEDMFEDLPDLVSIDDMGWQKNTRWAQYDSKSGHGFLVRLQTRKM